MGTHRMTANRLAVVAVAAAVALVAGCGSAASTGADAAAAVAADTDTATGTGGGIGLVGLQTHAHGDEGEYDAASATRISLADGASSAGGAAAVSATSSADGDLVRITAAGVYILSGSLSDGQVVVDVPEADDVTLVLDGADITSSRGPALQITAADEAAVVLADGSQNRLSDPAVYAQAEATVDPDTGKEVDAPNAALYSTADLTIAGGGALTVDGRANDGIASKDGLVILSGAITVTAADDGIRGKDFVSIEGGSVQVTAGGDGVKSDNEKEGTGIVAISGADTEVRVESGDDGVKGENAVDIVAGTLTVSSSVEGIEAARIYVEGGDTSVTSSDDGVNASASALVAEPSLEISGGRLTVDAEGDGVDSNGTLTMTGGDVLVHGPTSPGNGALDVDGDFQVSGGTLAAVGSADMLVGPSTDSAQAALVATFSAAVPAGAVLSVAGSDGTIAEIQTAKTSMSLVYSGPELVTGQEYTVSTGGAVPATVTAGEYSNSGPGMGRPGMGGPGMGGGPMGGAPGGARPDLGEAPPMGARPTP